MIRKYASIIPFYEKKILLHCRPDDIEEYPGVWAAFGGTIQGDANPRETLIRKARQEIDLDATDATMIAKLERKDGDLQVILYLFFYEIESPEQLSMKENGEWGWFTLDEVSSLQGAPLLDNMCAAVRQHLG